MVERSELMKFRLPNAQITVCGDLPPLVLDVLGDLRDSQLHLEPDAFRLALFAGRDDDGWVVSAEPGRSINVSPVRAAPGDADLVDALVGCLNRLAFEADPCRLHLHAAALELHGTGILLVGASGSGKSTVALELMRRGAHYLTDECLTVLPGSTTVFGYPKPITLKAGSIEHLCAGGMLAADVPTAVNGRAHLRAASFGSVAPVTTVGVIVAVRYATAEPCELAPLSAAEAAVRLLGDSLDGARLGSSALDVVAALVSGATAWDLAYSDAREAAAVIEDIRPPVRRHLAVGHRLALAGRTSNPTDEVDPYRSSDGSTRVVCFDDGAALHDGPSGRLAVLDAEQTADVDHPVASSSRSSALASLAEALGGVPRPVRSPMPWDPLSFALPGRPIRSSSGEPQITVADVGAARAGRCTGVVVAQLRRGRKADDGVAETALAAHRAGQFTCALLERELPGLVDLLVELEVAPILLKGPVSAHDGAVPAYLRDFGDLDLLVRPDQMDVSVTALLEAGFNRVFPRLSPDFDRRFAKSVTLRKPFSGDFGGGPAPTFELDLHRTLTPGPFGERIPLSELHDRSTPVRINGRWYRSLHPEHRFLHACLHVVVGSPEPRLHSVRDVVSTAPTTPGSIERVVEAAHGWGISEVVRHALAMTDDRFPGALAPELITAAAEVRPSRLERAYLASYHHRSMSYSLPAIATVHALGSWRDRRDFLLAHWRHRRAGS